MRAKPIPPTERKSLLKTDHDGKSQTASAVDQAHYPEPADGALPESSIEPSETEIAARAHKIWVERGKPAHSEEENWREARQQLLAAGRSKTAVADVHKGGGSVQS
jgi:hypothetical protein